MSELQEPRNDLFYNYEVGDADWSDGVNNNFLNIGSYLYMSVVNQTTTAPPGSPTLGDAYIVGTGATGDWSGEDGNIALWARPVGAGTPAAAWKFIIPKAGWLAYDQDTRLLHAHNGTNWSTNGFEFSFI